MQNIPDLSQAGLLQVSAKMASLDDMFLQLTFIFSEICNHYSIIFVFHLTVDEELWSWPYYENLFERSVSGKSTNDTWGMNNFSHSWPVTVWGVIINVLQIALKFLRVSKDGHSNFRLRMYVLPFF